MSYIGAIDVSQYQGAINWSQVPQPIVMMRATGGDGGLYLDPTAYINYFGAKKAAKSVGQYHFAGGGDPVAEADYFYKMVTPLNLYDVLVLDWEIENADPLGWVSSFVNRIHDLCGIWCLIYIDRDRLNRFDWSSIFKNCGLWIAAPDVAFDTPIQTSYTYVMQQGPTVNDPGITGNVVDSDAWYGTLDEFHMYGYMPSQQLPSSQSSVPVPPPSPPLAPQPPIPTVPIDIVKPSNVTEPVPPVVSQPKLDLKNIKMDVEKAVEAPSMWQSIISGLQWVRNLFDGRKTYLVGLVSLIGSLTAKLHLHSSNGQLEAAILASMGGVAITVRAAIAKAEQRLRRIISL